MFYLKIPFFLKPWFVFSSVWFLMTFFLALQVTESSYVIDELYIFVFIVSILFFFLGYFVSDTVLGYKKNSSKITLFPLEQGRLIKNLNIVLLIVLGISAYNVLIDGFPPLFAFWGVETKIYLDYGRFLGVLISLCGVLIVFSSVIKNKTLSVLYFLIGLTIIVLYVNRGPLIFYLFQLFTIVTILQFNKAERVQAFYRKFIFGLIFFLVFVVYFMSMFGNFRSTEEGFLQYLQITDSAVNNYSIELLWVASYFSIPISNLMHFIKTLQLDYFFMPLGPSIEFLTRIFPAFLWSQSDNLVSKINNTPQMIDGVHSYLFYWVSGLGSLGVILINFVYGFVSGVSKVNIFSYTSIITVLFFSFFIDYLFYFSTIFFILSSLIIYKRSCVPLKGVDKKRG